MPKELKSHETIVQETLQIFNEQIITGMTKDEVEKIVQETFEKACEDRDEDRKLYRELARAFHPDKLKGQKTLYAVLEPLKLTNVFHQELDKIFNKSPQEKMDRKINKIQEFLVKKLERIYPPPLSFISSIADKAVRLFLIMMVVLCLPLIVLFIPTLIVLIIAFKAANTILYKLFNAISDEKYHADIGDAFHLGADSFNRIAILLQTGWKTTFEPLPEGFLNQLKSIGLRVFKGLAFTPLVFLTGLLVLTANALLIIFVILPIVIASTIILSPHLILHAPLYAWDGIQWLCSSKAPVEDLPPPAQIPASQLVPDSSVANAPPVDRNFPNPAGLYSANQETKEETSVQQETPSPRPGGGGEPDAMD